MIQSQTIKKTLGKVWDQCVTFTAIWSHCITTSALYSDSAAKPYVNGIHQLSVISSFHIQQVCPGQMPETAIWRHNLIESTLLFGFTEDKKIILHCDVSYLWSTADISSQSVLCKCKLQSSGVIAMVRSTLLSGYTAEVDYPIIMLVIYTNDCHLNTSKN